MSTSIEAIHLLENKLTNLLSNYDFLKSENELLLQNIGKSQYKILEQQKIIEHNQNEYNLLKIAKTIEGSNEDKRDTKLKINTLIREIDKCIVQLNE